MCEFKYCCGTGKCFLSKTSPCSALAKDDLAENDSVRPTRSVRGRSVRMSYPGFLDHQELEDILSLADDDGDKERFDGWVGAAPKFLRAARAAIQPKVSKVA